MAKKKPTYNFFIQDREGNSININTLSEEERKEVGVWAYQTLLKGLGYEPVTKENDVPNVADTAKQEPKIDTRGRGRRR